MWFSKSFYLLQYIILKNSKVKYVEKNNKALMGLMCLMDLIQFIYEIFYFKWFFKKLIKAHINQ